MLYVKNKHFSEKPKAPLNFIHQNKVQLVNQVPFKAAGGAREIEHLINLQGRNRN